MKILTTLHFLCRLFFFLLAWSTVREIKRERERDDRDGEPCPAILRERGRERVGDEVWPAAEPTLKTPDHLNHAFCEQTRHTLLTYPGSSSSSSRDWGWSNWMDIDTEHTHLGIPFSKTELYCIGEHDSKRLLFLFFLSFFFFVVPYFCKWKHSWAVNVISCTVILKCQYVSNSLVQLLSGLKWCDVSLTWKSGPKVLHVFTDRVLTLQNISL